MEENNNNNLPPGFRFHPTDEELITYYLTNKVSDFGFTSRAITDVDLNKCEPWDLPARASMGEKEWYFFSLRDRKYPTGLRTNRATEAGYWKTTGKDKEIYRGSGSAAVLVGMKKTLVFYRGRAPKGEKTNWVMHEYRLESKLAFRSSKEEWVVCRVFQKSTTVKKPQQTSSSPQSLESPCDTNSIMNEFGDFVEVTNAATEIMTPPPLSAAMSNNNGDGGNNSMNMNLMMNNWMVPGGDPTSAATNNLAASLASSWPISAAAAAAAASTFLGGTNLSMNSLLLRALQLRNFQPSREVEVADHSSSAYLPQGNINNSPIISHHHNHHHHPFGDNEIISSNFAASSSSGALDPVVVIQQQPQEQPFDLDSGIW